MSLSTPTRRAALAGLASAAPLAAFASRALAQAAPAAANANAPSAAAAVDAFSRQVMAANPDQPGLGVAVVEDGRVTLARGYGVRRMGQPAPVTDATLFGIASNTKAMTAACLAMLVDEGKVEWDAPVTRYLPGFALSDETVTRLITVRDLLVHRSGLSLGAGDLMIWPQPQHTRQEIVAGLRHLPISGRFRDGYAYDNVLYVVAGEVIAAASGLPWERFVQTRILDPLGMADCTPAPRVADEGRRAAPHARLGPPVRGLGPQRPLPYDSSFDAAAAAGGVNASPRDIAKWMQCCLNEGALPNGSRLWSQAQNAELWKPQTITASGAGPTPTDPSAPIINAYALGWFVRDYRGERLLTHTGGLAGFISVTMLLPGRKSGIMIMTNAEESPVLRSMRYGGADRLMGRDDFDWIASSRTVQAERDAQTVRDAAVATTPSSGARPSLPNAAYLGTYRDPWYGTVTVGQDARGLTFSMDRTPLLRGRLNPFDGETFQTVFDDRTQEDAFVTFEAVEAGRPTRIRMRAVSPLADFSYDYQDLRLTRE